jgi:hypothetical protein
MAILFAVSHLIWSAAAILSAVTSLKGEVSQVREHLHRHL